MNEYQLDQLAYALGRACAKRREAMQLSTREFASRAQTHPSIVTRLETGKVMPTLVTLGYFTDVYGCSLAELVNEAESEVLSETKEAQSDVTEEAQDGLA